MKDNIKQAVDGLATLNEIAEALIALLQKMREEGQTRIGYVAGIISSDGHERIWENRLALARRTDELREQHDFPLFCSPDVLSEEVTRLLLANDAVSDDFVRFWRKVLTSGFVTDIFMTRRWEQSVGASDEHKIALEQKLTVHYH